MNIQTSKRQLLGGDASMMARGSKGANRLAMRKAIAIVVAGAIAAIIPTASAWATTYQLSVTGSAAGYTRTFSRPAWGTSVDVTMAVRDSAADGRCSQGSVTYNLRNAPDRTHAGPSVCGYGAQRQTTFGYTAWSPIWVDGVLVRVCTVIPNAPDACTSRYHDNPQI